MRDLKTERSDVCLLISVDRTSLIMSERTRFMSARFKFWRKLHSGLRSIVLKVAAMWWFSRTVRSK